MRSLIFYVVILLMPALSLAQTKPALVTGKQDSLWSKTLQENREYLVYTPPSMEANGPFLPQAYPVLYLLDGDGHFHSVTGMLQFLSDNGVVPEMIVVAIPNTDRMRDLTPTHVDEGLNGKPMPFFKTTGGMDNFFSFLKNELIPRIDSTYNTLPFRIFVGHSLGGLAAIHALYTIPETFDAYVSIDPSLWYDHQLLLKKAQPYFSNTKLEDKFLYLGQANTIYPGDTTRNYHDESIVQFNSILNAYDQSGIHYQYKYYPDDDHGSVPLITEYDALRFIFEGFKVNRSRIIDDPAALKSHFENYSTKMGVQFMPPENLVNGLGYQALQTDTAKAIAFFQINIDLYPDSYNVYDSMGEACMAAGDYKKAISFYEQSVRLNPDNLHGKEMIQEMKKQKKP